MGLSVNVATIGTRRDVLRTALRYSINNFKENPKHMKQNPKLFKRYQVLIRRIYNHTKHVIRTHQDYQDSINAVHALQHGAHLAIKVHPLFGAFGGGELLTYIYNYLHHKPIDPKTMES